MEKGTSGGEGPGNINGGHILRGKQDVWAISVGPNIGYDQPGQSVTKIRNGVFIRHLESAESRINYAVF